MRGGNLSMKKNEQERFQDVVRLWVEMWHFDRELGGLVEDSDEIGEIYEFENWFRDPQEKEESIMGLHVAIEQASSIAYKLREKAEERLTEELIKIIRNKETGSYFGKELVNINEVNLEEVYEIFIDEYDNIYDYTMDNQYPSFVKALLLADEILGTTE